MRDSFIFYKEYKEAIEDIKDDEKRLQFYDCITDYVFSGKVPENTNDVIYSLFVLIKDKLDVSYSSYHNFEARRSAKYRKWKQEVLTRDNYKCKKCGSDKKLHAHHIKSFSDNKELRYELSNGITLCDKCHKEVHKNER